MSRYIHADVRGTIVGVSLERAGAAPVSEAPAPDAAGAFVLLESASALWVAYGVLLVGSLVFWVSLAPTSSAAVTVQVVQDAYTVTMAALVCAGWGSLLLAAAILRSFPWTGGRTASPSHLVAAASFCVFGGLNLAAAAVLYVTLRALSAADLVGYTSYEGVLFGLWIAAAVALTVAGLFAPRTAAARGLVGAKGRSVFPLLFPITALVNLVSTLVMALSLLSVLGASAVTSSAVVIGLEVGAVLAFLVSPGLAIATFALVLASAAEGLRNVARP